MDIGLRRNPLARPGRPASHAQRPALNQQAGAPCVPRVAISPRASFPPASRRSSCLRLVVGAINLHRGLSPSSRWSCQAYGVARRHGCRRNWARTKTNRYHDQTLRSLCRSVVPHQHVTIQRDAAITIFGVRQHRFVAWHATAVLRIAPGSDRAHVRAYATSQVAHQLARSVARRGEVSQSSMRYARSLVT